MLILKSDYFSVYCFTPKQLIFHQKKIPKQRFYKEKKEEADREFLNDMPSWKVFQMTAIAKKSSTEIKRFDKMEQNMLNKMYFDSTVSFIRTLIQMIIFKDIF